MFIGGVYVIEALSVILQVGSYKLRKKRIFKMAPIHHHFEALGWPESKIIIAVLDCGIGDGAVRAHHVETALRWNSAGKQVVVVGMAQIGGCGAVKLLLEHGAKVRAVDEKATGETCLESTVEPQEETIVSRTRSWS